MAPVNLADLQLSPSHTAKEPDSNVFDRIETKQDKYKCKFCGKEYPYNLRDMASHFDQCEALLQEDAGS